MPELNGYFRCECGKIHARAYIGQTSVCEGQGCQRLLWPQVWGSRPAVKLGGHMRPEVPATPVVVVDPARLVLDDDREVAVVDHLRGNLHNTNECAICQAERRTESIISGG